MEVGKLLAEDEAAKCGAAKEVIKSLTLQLKEMAILIPNRTFEQYGNVVILHQSSSQLARNAFDAKSNTPSGIPLLPVGSNTKLSGNHSTIVPTTKETLVQKEWVEQDDAGVYITFITSPGGMKDLKRVRFSRKKFSEAQAEQWWTKNRMRVYDQYGILGPGSASIRVHDAISQDIKSP